MPSILFVCTGNQFRSPIAAETFRQQLKRDGRGADWRVTSAGTWTVSGQPVFTWSKEIARSMGIDISGHTTKSVDAKLLQEADLVLVMEAGHKEAILVEFPFARGKVRLLSEVLEGMPFDIPDPAGSAEEANEILRELVGMIRSQSWKIYELFRAN